MKRVKIIALIIWFVFLITACCLSISYSFITREQAKKNDEIVEQYENGLDELNLEYDDDNHQYDVYVGNEDKGTLKHYIVKLEDVVVIPYTENEVHFEITKSGKCKLYFFIKWEVE